MELTVQNVFGLILRSKLLPLEQARAMFARWQQEAGAQAQSVPHFGRWLVTQKYLTEYQSWLLMRGHVDSFFLGEYKILDRLGSGRMAGVYRAVHPLGQVVAIKVLPPSKAKEAHLLARFTREARMAMSLQHPNIVRAFQVGKENDLHYFVMEHLEGVTLEEVLQKRGKFPPAEAVRLVYQALLGLQHVHENRLVHRDLKPSNIMLVPGPDAKGDTTRCVVKILDIGLGRELYTEEQTATADNLTTLGSMLGTPDYMAPEQARDSHSVDIRADVYSLGCVLYHLLAGRPPFTGATFGAVLAKHANEQPASIASYNPAVPDGLEQIVGWMMSKDPQKRYPTPERAAGSLQMFLAAGHETNPAPDDTAKMSQYLGWLQNQKSEEPAPASKAVKAAESAKEAKPAKDPKKLQAALRKVKKRMTKLLMLKQASAGQSPTQPKPVGKVKVGKPVAPPPPASPGSAKPKTSPMLPAVGTPAVAQPEKFDVELVSLGEAGQSGEITSWKSLLRFTQRDLVMFLVGVVGTVVVLLLAKLLAPK